MGRCSGKPRDAPMSATPQVIRSRDNASYKACVRLAAGPQRGPDGAREVWIEGEHLCEAALRSGPKGGRLVVSESYWPVASVKYRKYDIEIVAFDDKLWSRLSTLPSPAPLALVLTLPAQAQVIDALAPSVVLDRVQDPGNVGSILRCAAAFGFTQVLALRDTAHLWSPKVVRAGMGAHFGLRLIEGLDAADLAALQVPLLVTSSHAGRFLHAGALPWPCAWCFGHEGQGVDPALNARAQLQVQIAQPGGQESLNVAAAAAICLHASAVPCVDPQAPRAAKL